MVNVELLNLVEDIKPILRMFVVYPKNVTAEKSTSNYFANLFLFLMLAFVLKWVVCVSLTEMNFEKLLDLIVVVH